jgi:hypothetical protein
MGRPRKRRREGEADESTVFLTDTNSNNVGINEGSTFGSFGMITPPQFQDSSLPIDVELNDHGAMSQIHHIDSNAFGISPISAIEYVSFWI